MTLGIARGRSGGPFYGWVVVAGTFVVLFVGYGVAYSFAAFFHALRDEFGATRGEVSLVFAITGFLYFSLGAVSGPLADRVGPRRVVLGGVLLIGAGLLLASRARELWQVYLTYGLGVGVGVGFAYVPAIGAVQRWFVRRRGFASGLAVAGIGAGNLIVPPLMERLIEATSWRTAYAVLGIGALALGCGAALLLEHSPARRGLLPDGDAAPVDGSAPAAGMTVREALHARPFWLLYIATIATSLGVFIPFAHLAPYARDHGLSESTGTLLVGLIGVGSAAGRLGLGGTADRLGRRRALVGTFFGMALTLLWWTAATRTWSLAAFAVFFGVCYGGFVALVPALAADYFGGRSVGAIIGLLYTGASVGALAGPTLAGVAYDLRDSYTLPIAIAAGANLIAVACMALLADPAAPARSGHVRRSATETV